MARTVTGTVLHEDGTPWAGGTITITLLETFVTSLYIYPGEAKTVTLDSNGQFSVALSTPDVGDGAARYRAVLPNKQGFEFLIEAGASVNLSTLLIVYGGGVSQSELLTLLEQAALLVTYSITTARTMDGTEDLIEITSGTFAQTLVAATGSKKPVAFTNSGSGTVTLTAAGSDLINGSSTYALPPGASATLVDIASARWLAR